MPYIATLIANTPTSKNGVRLLFKGAKKPKVPVASSPVQQTADSVAQAERDALAQAGERNGLANTKKKRNLIGQDESGSKTLLG